MRMCFGPASLPKQIPCMDFQWQCSSALQVQNRQGGRSCTCSRKAVLLGTRAQTAATAAGEENDAATTAGQEAAAAAQAAVTSAT